MGNTIKERTIEFVNHLGIKMKDFERRCNLSSGYVTSMRKGFGEQKLNNVLKAYPQLNREWLLYGEGEMLNEQATPTKKEEGIPFLDGEQVRAGALSGYGQPLTTVDTIRLPELSWREGDFAVKANGRSMLDPLHPEYSIPDGAIVVLRPWMDRNIHWGEMYCIYTYEGYAIKRIMRGDDDEHIKCVSNNEAEGFEPYQVEHDSILGIARVTAIINVKTLWA